MHAKEGWIADKAGTCAGAGMGKPGLAPHGLGRSCVHPRCGRCMGGSRRIGGILRCAGITDEMLANMRGLVVRISSGVVQLDQMTVMHGLVQFAYRRRGRRQTERMIRGACRGRSKDNGLLASASASMDCGRSNFLTNQI